MTRKRRMVVAIASIAIVVACGERSPTSPGSGVQVGMWASDQASLAVTDTGGHLQILAGGCVGSYGDISPLSGASTFAIPGTFTQLTGVYPGKVQYDAQFTGSVQGNQLSITVSVPALQKTFGPFLLTYGVSRSWQQCHYP